MIKLGDDEPTPVLVDDEPERGEQPRGLAVMLEAARSAVFGSRLDYVKATRSAEKRLRAAVPGWVTVAARTASGYEYRAPGAEAVAQSAGIQLEVACLAAVLASEALDAVRWPQYADAIASAVLTECDAKGLSVYSRVTMAGVSLRSGKSPEAAGHLGRQSGRWCSSYQTPRRVHVDLARSALMLGPDGSGARRWVDLKIMDGGRQGGRRLAYDAASLARKWHLEGWRWVGPRPEIDPYRLCLWRRGGGVELAETLAMVADGRRRWRSGPR